MTNTKYYLTVGVEVALFVVLVCILIFTDKFTEGLFAIWIGAVVAVAAQYSIANVVASGQSTKTSTQGADSAAIDRKSVV